MIDGFCQSSVNLNVHASNHNGYYGDEEDRQEYNAREKQQYVMRMEVIISQIWFIACYFYMRRQLPDHSICITIFSVYIQLQWKC